MVWVVGGEFVLRRTGTVMLEQAWGQSEGVRGGTASVRAADKIEPGGGETQAHLCKRGPEVACGHGPAHTGPGLLRRQLDGSKMPSSGPSP